MAEVCRVLGGQGEKCHLEISIDTLLRETLVGLLSLSPFGRGRGLFGDVLGCTLLSKLTLRFPKKRSAGEGGVSAFS